MLIRIWSQGPISLKLHPCLPHLLMLTFEVIPPRIQGKRKQEIIIKEILYLFSQLDQL